MSRPVTVSLVLLAVSALIGADCAGPEPTPLPAAPCGLLGVPGLVDGSVVNPFPSAHVTVTTDDTATGCAIAIPAGALPVGVGSDPLDVGRFAHRDGFSPGQSSFWWPQVAVDPASLPAWQAADLGMGSGASIQLWDLDAGVQLPAFAEVDAFPEQGDHQRAVLVRPLRALPLGGSVAVVVTNRVRTRDGAALSPPGPFAQLLRDSEEAEWCADSALGRHYCPLLAELERLGVTREELVLVWDFPVGTFASTAAPLTHVITAMRAELPLDRTFEPTLVQDALLDADTGPAPAAGLWRELRGSFRVTHYLWDEDDAATDDAHDAGQFRLDDRGLPIARDIDDAYFVAVVPDSVRGAAAGSVPVVVFGHGIFSSPHEYLAHATDQNATIELLNRLGAIGIGGEWRGLTERDRPDAVRVAVNLGRFPLLTDKMVQGVSNQAALARLTQTAFIDHDAFAAADGASLIDPTRVHYFGISLGGIEGATLLSLSEVLQTGVVHVPGSTWSTMLERSTNWNAFEPFVFEHLDLPWERQLIYSVSQLLWDPVDPILHGVNLRGRSVLMQVSIGDEQVPNFTAESLARTAGIPLLSPGVEAVAGLGQRSMPTEAGASGYMQFDPQLGRPPLVNRPAPSGTGAHAAIRHTDEAISQIVAFLAGGAEGTIIDPCDGAPCVVDPPQ